MLYGGSNCKDSGDPKDFVGSSFLVGDLSVGDSLVIMLPRYVEAMCHARKLHVLII